MASFIPYAPEVKLFTNSKEFSYLADHFDRHGVYTTFPENTIQWKEFWIDVKNKCLNGFSEYGGYIIE